MEPSIAIGIAAADFAATARSPRWRVHDPVQAIALVARGADGVPAAVIVALDLVALPTAATRRLRERITSQLGAPLHAVVIHATHTHSAPAHRDLDGDAFDALVVGACRSALATALPASAICSRGELPGEMSCRRRWDSGDELGTFSVIGYDGCRAVDGSLRIADNVRGQLDGLRPPSRPIPDGATLPPADDRRISLTRFVDASGATIGGIARAAVHVDHVAQRHGPLMSAEYPGALRRWLDEAYGGRFLFLNGPCGDVRPTSLDASWETCECYGRTVADALIALPASPPRPLAYVSASADRLHLPTRDDLPSDERSLEATYYALRQERGERLAIGADAAEFRAWDQRLWSVDLVKWHRANIDGRGVCDVFARCWPYEMQLIDFGGLASYLMLQDELFSCAGVRLGAGDDVDLVELCGGDWYVGPREDLARGGYEATATIYALGAFETVVERARALVARHVGGGHAAWTRPLLAEQLRTLGLAAGDDVAVHSAARACGYVDGGLDAILAAIRDAVGPAGTLLFPTFTGSPHDAPERPPTFDRQRSRGWTGALAELARARPDAVRSPHPTHSFAALGPRAVEYTRSHRRSRTPCDARSPLRKLVTRGGRILLIGVGLEALTLMHAVEEELLAPDPCFAEPCTCLLIDGGRRELRDFRLHTWHGPARAYERMRAAFVFGGALRAGAVGDAPALLLDAAAAWRIACAAVTADRGALLAMPSPAAAATTGS